MKELEKILLDVFRAQKVPDAAGVAKKSAEIASQAIRDAKVYELRAVLTVEDLQQRFNLKRTHIYRIIKRQLKIKRNA